MAPRLAPLDAPIPADMRAAGAAALWSAAEQAEAEFDYEAARNLYREAVRKASGDAEQDLTERYAAFLVERYGQFEEVAAWLDDPAYDPTAGATPPTSPALARHVATAAAETGHERAAELDDKLADAFHDPDSLLRVAERLIDNGETHAALTVLSDHASHLDGNTPAFELLSRLRTSNEDTAHAALKLADFALERGDLAAAERALIEQRADWGSTAAYRSLAARVQHAAADARRNDLNIAIDAALAATEFATALKAARALEALGDATRIQDVRRFERLHDLNERLLACASLRAGTAAALNELRAILREHGGDVAVPEHLVRDWQLVRDASAAGLDPVDASDQLSAMLQAPELAEVGDFDGLQALRDRLPAGLHAVEPLASALLALADHLDRGRRRAAAAVLRAVESNLLAGEVDAAERELTQYLMSGAPRTSTIRDAQRRIEELQRQHSQRVLLQAEVQEALDNGRLLAARRFIGKLAELPGTIALVAQARAEVEGRAAKELRAAPMPPFGLTISGGRLAVGAHDGRLALVQGTLWVTVNLETSGLSPFRLPDAYAIDPKRPSRLGSCNGRMRLVAFADDRLIVVDQDAGSPPEVVAARPLDELLRGETLAAAAIEPSAPSWTLLTQSADKPGRLLRIDAQTLDVISAQRHKPSLSGLAAVRDSADVLVTTAMEHRAGRHWAMAQLGDSAVPLATWTQQELMEPLAAPMRAVAWPEQDRLFCSYSTFDMFDASKVVREPSLLVMRSGKPIFATSDLRRRFAPTEKLIIDHAWSLDPANGRLWFAALPRSDNDSEDAMLLGVDARTLRADKTQTLAGVARILAIEALTDGAAALCRLHDTKLGVVRAIGGGGAIDVQLHRLPIQSA